MTISYDRTVHAAHPDGTVVARYNRTGKYYAEKPDGTRKHITLAQAVALAVLAAPLAGGYVALGRIGGLAFDAAYRKAVRLSAVKD